MASPTQINIQPADDSRLRELEVARAVHDQRFLAQDKVNQEIATHLGTLTEAFQEHRLAIAEAFSKFQLRVLAGALILFASSSNAERVLHLVGVPL